MVIRASGWKKSPDIEWDYQERPANGWDIRAEVAIYLPGRSLAQA